MGAIKTTKKIVSLGWNFSRWIGIGEIKKNGALIKDMAKKTIAVNSSQGFKGETFEQTMRRLKLTEASLKKRIKSCNQIMAFCSLFSILTIGYTIYIFERHLYLAGLVGSLMTILLWAYVFREHFTRYQIQKRRLKCTFHEWLADTFHIRLPRGQK